MYNLFTFWDGGNLIWTKYRKASVNIYSKVWMSVDECSFTIKGRLFLMKGS